MSVIALLLAGAVVATAQSDPVDLTLVLPEKARIELRLESVERVDGGEPTISREAYRVEVRREGETGYRTVWSDLDNPRNDPMIIITDEALVPVRIVNIDELIAHMAARLEDDGGLDEDDAATVAFFRSLPPETLAVIITRNLNLAAYGQGTVLVPGERSDYQQPGGRFGPNGSVTMSASFLLESVDEKTGKATVVWTNELPPEEARKALPGLIGDMLTLTGADAQTAEKMDNLLATGRFVVRTECRYQIAMANGLAERAECDTLKEVSIAGETQRTETHLVATQRLLD